MDDPDDLAEALTDAHRASTNSGILTVITVAFGIVWLSDRELVPLWVVSVWFVFVIPLNLYLLFMYRHRYRVLREEHEGEAPAKRE